MIRGGVGDKFQ